MTEIEKAHKNDLEIRELTLKIQKVKLLQLDALKSNDNIVVKVWADKIKELKAERQFLDSQNKYMKLSVFVQVVKTKLTKDQFIECWDQVDAILLNPSLLQS